MGVLWSIFMVSRSSTHSATQGWTGIGVPMPIENGVGKQPLPGDGASRAPTSSPQPRALRIAPISFLEPPGGWPGAPGLPTTADDRPLPGPRPAFRDSLSTLSTGAPADFNGLRDGDDCRALPAA